jgi:hypothetical protein
MRYTCDIKPHRNISKKVGLVLLLFAYGIPVFSPILLQCLDVVVESLRWSTTRETETWLPALLLPSFL